MDLAKSCRDRFCQILAICAAGVVLRVRAQSQIARTRALFERFSEMSENRETGWWSRTGFELSTPTSPFHRKIVRGFGDKLPED